MNQNNTPDPQDIAAVNDVVKSTLALYEGHSYPVIFSSFTEVFRMVCQHAGIPVDVAVETMRRCMVGGDDAPAAPEQLELFPKQ